MNVSRRLALWAVLALVGVAFADSSIVVLALPDLLRKFSASVTGVAWVITSYNLALALASFALIAVVRRVDVARLFRVGCALFGGATIACGLANDFGALVAFRAIQGLGGALLLAGSLRFARSFASSPRRGATAWSAATVIGAALGPACGGALTELMGWRSIFFAQAPFAALALVVTLLTFSSVESATAAVRRPRLAVSAALVLVSASLAGLLFLVVVLLIDVWGVSPVKAAIVVSAVPLGALAAQLSFRHPGATSTRVGVVLLSAGLAVLAFLPSTAMVWVAAGLAVAGGGLGLILRHLTQLMIPDAAVSDGDVPWLVGVRHLGLVLGLLMLTPLLAGDLTAASRRATLEGIATVLEAPVPAQSKLQLAIDLAPVLAGPPTGALPNFSQLLERRQIRGADRLGHALDSVVKASITRGFRRTFLLAAILALLTWLPVRSLLSDRRRSRGRPRAATAAAAAAALALVGSEVAQGALSYGTTPAASKPCAARSLPKSAGAAERTFVGGLDAIACRLHTGREQLIADVAGTSLASALVRAVRHPASVPGWLIGYLIAELAKI
jgi:MFS family permease